MPCRWAVHDAGSGRLVGFAMISDGIPEPMDEDLVGPSFLWKLLIDAEEQGNGYGPGSPRGFYLRYGFADTGRVLWGENVLALDLRRART